MTILIARQTLRGGIEAGPGIEAVANAPMLVDRGLMPDPQVVAQERRNASGFMGTARTPVHVGFQSLRVTAPLIPGDALGTLPTIDPLLRACHLARVVSADVDVVYTPEASQGSTATLIFNASNQQHKMLGTRGNARLSWEAGNYPMIDCDLTGLYQEPTAGGVPATAFAVEPRPQIVSAASAANVSVFGNTDAVIQRFELNLNNRVSARDNPGGRSIDVTDRGPTGTMVVEAPALADKNHFSDLTSGTIGTIAWDIGTTPGAIVRFEATGKAQLIDISPQNIDDILHYALAFRLIPSAGADEFALTLM